MKYLAGAVDTCFNGLGEAMRDVSDVRISKALMVEEDKRFTQLAWKSKDGGAALFLGFA